MKKMKFVLLTAFVFAFTSLGCAINDTGDDVEKTSYVSVKGSEIDSNGVSNICKVDFETYPQNYSLHVKNNTSSKLVAFKGKPSEKQLIGGISASGDH